MSLNAFFIMPQTKEGRHSLKGERSTFLTGGKKETKNLSLQFIWEYNQTMDIPAIIAHALTTKEKAVQLTLQEENGGLSVHDFLVKEKASFCHNEDEEKAWDVAFLHGEEGVDAVMGYLREEGLA